MAKDIVEKEEISGFFKQLQDDICAKLVVADGHGTFAEDLWFHHSGGGGRTRIMNGGGVIQKGGVNFSEVWGAMPDNILKALQLENVDFYATGVSIVMHPHSPMVPIIHMNVRYFEMANGTYWFGGGIDLTPHYINHDDAKYFHQALKNVCDRHDAGYYHRFKTWADDYFYIAHRGETRGVGGIFFDRLKANEISTKKQIFDFVKDVGFAFAPVYTFLMIKNKDIPFDDRHKRWQYLRRGRYVEFNLVYDKGTKFGLDTSGRTESILMSMPPEAHWEYNYAPEQGSEEQKTLTLLKKGVAWI